MKERDFLNWVIACAEQYGWLVKHVPAPMVATRDGRRFVGSIRARGLPDLFMLHDDPPRLIIAEVKGDKGKLSKSQQEFLRMARDVAERGRQHGSDVWHLPEEQPVGVYVFQPGQEQMIERLLRTRVLA